MRKIVGPIVGINVSDRQVRIDVATSAKAEPANALLGYSGMFQRVIFNAGNARTKPSELQRFADAIRAAGGDAIAVQNAVRVASHKDGTLWGEFLIERAHKNNYGRTVFELTASGDEFPYRLFIAEKGAKVKRLRLDDLFDEREFVSAPVESTSDEELEALNSEEDF